jgi:hypothetical protein
MKMYHFIVITCMLLLLGSAPRAIAADYNCPAANNITCVPAQKTVGAWRDNGGMSTGNTFAPNSRCANVINLPNGQKRLLCCYSHCGVFLQDVPASACSKTSVSHFACR